MICTYKITHVSTGSFYIGCTKNYQRRLGDHTSQLRCQRHESKKLQELYNSDSNIEFSFTTHQSIDDAFADEYRQLSEHANNPLLINARIESRLGGPEYSEERRQHLSAIKTGLVHSDETKAKMSASRIGKAKNPEWTDKIVDSVRQAVTVDGIEYRSKTDAANAHGISLQLACYRFSATGKKWTGWVELGGE